MAGLGYSAADSRGSRDNDTAILDQSLSISYSFVEESTF